MITLAEISDKLPTLSGSLLIGVAAAAVATCEHVTPFGSGSPEQKGAFEP